MPPRSALDMIEVGVVAVRDADTFVLPDAALTTSLLGLSSPSRLHRSAYRDDRRLLEE